MAKVRYQQNTFSGGEISPRLRARTDLDKYYQSAEEIENAVVTQHGPVDRRWGTRFAGEVKDSSSAVRLIPFRFSSIQNYILEFGNLYMRVWKDGAIVLAGGVFPLEFPFQFGGTVPFELATLYTTTELEELQFAQSADTLFIVHQNHPPRKVIRTRDDSWTIQDIVFNADPTTEPEVDLATGLTLSATTGTGVTATADTGVFLKGDIGRFITSGQGQASITGFTSATIVTVDITQDFLQVDLDSGTWTLGGSPGSDITPSEVGPVNKIVTIDADEPGNNVAQDTWRASDVGRFIKANSGLAEITELVSASQVKAKVIVTFFDTTEQASGTWTQEDKQWSVTNGFPGSITFDEGRLLLAGSPTFPGTVWGSAVNDFENFNTGTNDDDPFEFRIASPLVDVIRWMVPSNQVFIGTIGGEFRLHGGGQSTPVTPTNVHVESETSVGSAPFQPVRVDDAVLFINLHKTQIRELAFSLDKDTFVSTDLLLLADHLVDTGKTIEQIVYQSEPFPIVWVRRTDGTLLALTYLRAQNIVGWSRHIIGGSFAGGSAVVESMAVIPHWTEAHDAVFMVVKRTIAGVTKRYVEYFERGLNTDSSLSITGTSLTSISGLDHLEKEQVRLVGDGGLLENQQVISGTVAVNPPSDQVDVGLGYESKLVTVEPELPSTNQTGLLGLDKRWETITIRFFQTTNCLVNGLVVPFRTTNDLMDNKIPVFTGDIKISERGFKESAKLTITQPDPLPWTIQAYFGRLTVNDERT